MIVLRGVSDFLAAVDKKNEQMRTATRLAVAKALHMIERRAKQKLAQKSHPPGTPTPSGPGEPPALVTGNLRRSISVTGPEKVGPATWRGEVGPTAVYGRIQELGGWTGHGYLPPRPYMEPGYRELQAEIRAMFQAAWSQAILE